MGAAVRGDVYSSDAPATASPSPTFHVDSAVTRSRRWRLAITAVATPVAGSFGRYTAKTGVSKKNRDI